MEPLNDSTINAIAATMIQRFPYLEREDVVQDVHVYTLEGMSVADIYKTVRRKYDAWHCEKEVHMDPIPDAVLYKIFMDSQKPILSYELDSMALSGRLGELLKKQPKRTRDIIGLRLMGYSGKHIGFLLNITHASVRKHLQRSLERMKKYATSN